MPHISLFRGWLGWFDRQVIPPSSTSNQALQPLVENSEYEAVFTWPEVPHELRLCVETAVLNGRYKLEEQRSDGTLVLVTTRFPTVRFIGIRRHSGSARLHLHVRSASRERRVRPRTAGAIDPATAASSPSSSLPASPR
jgi:hypothetical protein